MLIGRYWLQARRGLLEAGDVAQAEAPLLLRCSTQRDGRPSTKREADELRNLAKLVTGVICRYFLFIGVAKPVVNYCAAFAKRDIFQLCIPVGGYCGKHSLILLLD